MLGASSASASGVSSDSNPYSENIAIIPKKSSGKLVEGSGDDSSFVFPDESSTSTEAPSFVQRKVSKIIRKLVTLSQISNALQGQYQQNNDLFQYPSFADLDNPNGPEIDREETNSYTRQEPNVSEFARKFAIGSEVEQRRPIGSQVEQKRLKGNDKELKESDDDRKEPISFDFVQFNDKSESDKPLRFQLDTNISTDNNTNYNKTEMKAIPANIALFVIEIFTSLIGLTLGAVTQLNHTLSQNNTV